jgi:hypothetical protein
MTADSDYAVPALVDLKQGLAIVVLGFALLVR